MTPTAELWHPAFVVLAQDSQDDGALVTHEGPCGLDDGLCDLATYLEWAQWTPLLEHGSGYFQLRMTSAGEFECRAAVPDVIELPTEGEPEP